MKLKTAAILSEASSQGRGVVVFSVVVVVVVVVGAAGVSVTPMVVSTGVVVVSLLFILLLSGVVTLSMASDVSGTSGVSVVTTTIPLSAVELTRGGLVGDGGTRISVVFCAEATCGEKEAEVRGS